MKEINYEKMKSLIEKVKELLNFLMRVLKYHQLWQKSKRDFKLARGKQHLELLKKIKEIKRKPGNIFGNRICQGIE